MTYEPEELIQMVKENPCLFDKKFKQRAPKKALIWSAIGAKFNVSGLDVCNRWSAIKDRYFLLKQRLHSDPNNEDNHARLKEYRYTKLLSFLDDVIPYNRGSKVKSKRINYPVRSTDAKTFEKGQTVLLIKELAKHPSLYIRSSMCFTSVATRQAALKEIVEKLKPHMPNVTTDMIVKKIRIIKSQFFKEKKLLTLAVVRSTDPAPQPKLWFYDMVSFLDEDKPLDENPNGSNNYCESEESEGEGKHSAGDDDDDITEDYEWEASNSYEAKSFEEIHIKEQPQSDDETFANEDCVGLEEMLNHENERTEEKNVQKKDCDRIRSNMYLKCTSLLESLSEQLKPLGSGANTSKERCTCQNSSPHSLLGRMVESELANVSEDIYTDSKWKILRILEEAQRKHSKEKECQVQKRTPKLVKENSYDDLKELDDVLSTKHHRTKKEPIEYSE